MQNNLALTDSQINALPITFDLQREEGGNVGRLSFTHIKGALLDTGSLSHLPFTSDILQKDGSLCYIIIEKPGKEGTLYQRVNVTYKCYWQLGSIAKGNMVGLCFLFYPSLADRSIAQIGVALLPESRGRGFGRGAVHKLLRYAFEALDVHRVVAHIACPTSSKETPSERKKAISRTRQLCWRFEKYGFQFEGINRGSMRHPKDDIWQDVYRLSLLDTDWFAMQPSSGLTLSKRVASTPFEGMLERHGAEREEMLGWLDAPTSPYKEEGGTATGRDSDDDGDCYGTQDSDDCADDSDDDSVAETV